MSRPSDKSPELLEAFLERVMKGESVKSICDGKDMPSRETVYKWMRDDEEFADKYARAKEVCSHLYQEEIIEIADRPKKTRNDVEADKLRADVRKWVASKLNPKKYGDKIDVNQTGNLKIEWHRELTNEADVQTDTGL